MFDSDGEWWRVEARRGHGPHGASRRRARSSTGRVRGRREVGMLVDRERCADKNAGQSGQGCEIRRANVRLAPTTMPRLTDVRGRGLRGKSQSGAKY